MDTWLRGIGKDVIDPPGRRRSLKFLVAASALAWCPAHGSAPVGPEAPARTRADTATGALEPCAWLAGAWVGAGFGGIVECTWLPPRNDRMLGAFRAARNDSYWLYELLELRTSPDSGLVLRVKHFSPELVGWEEKQKFIEFNSVRVSPGVMEFEDLLFRRTAEGHDVEVLISENDHYRTERLSYRPLLV